MKRTLLTLCGLALAAGPLAAGTVYMPTAINETRGAYRRVTEVWATNPDSVIQGFVIRRLASSTNGTTRFPGDEIGPYYLAPGETRRFTDLVPAGFRGMLELDGSLTMQFTGSLTSRTLQGIKVAESEIPILTHDPLAPPNETLHLQGLERIGSTITTNLGIANLSASTAACKVTLRHRGGLLIIQNVPFSVMPLSQIQFDDAFAILGLTVVPEGARAEVTCNQAFWTYASVYDELTGAVELIEPAISIGRSLLQEPGTGGGGDGGGGDGGGDGGGGDGGGGDSGGDPNADAVFTRPGLIIRYPVSRWATNNFRVDMPFGGVRTFRRMTVDFDFKIGNWDNQRPSGFHCIFWLNNGSSWNNMFGYVNTRGTQSRTVFQVNATGAGWLETTQNGSPQPGGNYKMHYEYNLDTDIVSYVIKTAGGTRVVGREYNLRGSTFSTSRFFIEFGAQHAEEGPEAYTPGWEFSNLRAEYFE